MELDVKEKTRWLEGIGFNEDFIRAFYPIYSSKNPHKTVMELVDETQNHAHLYKYHNDFFEFLFLFIITRVCTSEYYDSKYDLLVNVPDFTTFATELFYTPEASVKCEHMCVNKAKLVCEPSTFISCIYYYMYQQLDHTGVHELDMTTNRYPFSSHFPAASGWFSVFDINRYQTCVVTNEKIVVPLPWLDKYDFIKWGSNYIYPQFNSAYGLCEILYLLNSNKTDEIVYEFKRIVYTYFENRFDTNVIYNPEKRQALVNEIWETVVKYV